MRLSAPARLFWYAVNVGLGLVPSFLFFAWVERNCSLPWVGLELHWPWLNFWTWPVTALAVFDFLLILIFGVLHSATAQEPFQAAIAKLLPPQTVRSFYLALTGLSLLAVMGLWQSTGIVLWALRVPAEVGYALSLSIYWFLLFLCGRIAARFDALHFVGLRQIAETRAEASRKIRGNPQLVTSGFYAWVRHPIYTISMIAFLLTPVMTLDRLVVAASVALYLAFAIPVEERKLVALFGSAYEEYRRRVPAVIPGLKGRKTMVGSIPR